MEAVGNEHAGRADGRSRRRRSNRTAARVHVGTGMGDARRLGRQLRQRTVASGVLVACKQRQGDSMARRRQTRGADQGLELGGQLAELGFA